MRKLFYNQQQSQTLRFACMLLVLAVMAFVPVGVWAEETYYDLWIGDTQVTSNNMADVLEDGTVSFEVSNDASGLSVYTLTLNGATLGNANASASIFSSLQDLTIRLQGANTLYGCIYGNQKGETLGNLIFVGSKSSESNSLSITNVNADAPIYGFGEVFYEGTYIQSDYPGVRWDSRTHRHLYYPANQATTGAPTVPALTITQNYCYPIWVYNGQASQGTGYTQVTEVNQANVLGDNTATVSVNDGILVLNNASLTPQSDYAFVLGEDIDLGLRVWLQGTNTVQGNGFYFTGSAEAPYSLDFERYEETTTCSFAIIGNNDINYSIAAAASGNVGISTPDGLVYNENMQTVYYPYSLSINGTPVTSLNRTNVFGDNTASVRFDGHNRLILNNANLTGITVDGTNTLPETGLEIYLVGTENVVTGNIVSNVETHTIPLAFTTNEAAPGKLTIGPYATGANVFQGFTVTYLNNLEAVTNGADAATTTIVQTKLTLALVVDEENKTVTTDYDSVTPDGEHKNVTIDGIMYTLNDNGVASDPDGFVGKDGLVLNSTVNADQLNTAMNSDPGSDAFIAAFKGLTFLLPPGTGKVTLIGAYCDANHVGQEICVKFGNQEPVRIRLTTTKTDYVIPYAVEQSTYGYIYLPASSSGAPAMMATRVPDRRIGPKSSVAGGLGGLSIKSSSIDVPAAPAASYMMCSKDMMATQMASLSEGNAEDGFSFGVSDITDLSDDVFRAGSTLAPRRAPGYALPEKLTFIDLSETKIMGMEVSRTSGPFKDVPNNTFIYMPAGNTVAAGTKNVVIGSVCSDMELNGATGSTDLFKAKKSFTAAKATLKRSFTKDELATVCLPYSIMASDAAELGKFYTVTSVSSSAATLSSPVMGNLSASTAYVVKPSDNKTDLVAKSAVVSTDSPNGSTLVGVFKRTDYTSGNLYCYAGEEKGDIKVGQFVKMKGGAYVPPFRAYLVGEGSAPTLSLLWEGQDNDNNVTAVQQVKTTGGQQAREGWWTLNGIRLNGQPAKAGMYVNNGRLVIVK